MSTAPTNRQATVKKTEPRRFCKVTAGLPCLVNIYVLSGLSSSCEVCAGSVPKMRESAKFLPVEGGFYLCEKLVPEQVSRLRSEIAERVKKSAATQILP